MDNIFQAVHSKLVCTAVKLHTDLPRRKNKSNIFVCINYTYQVVKDLYVWKFWSQSHLCSKTWKNLGPYNFLHVILYVHHSWYSSSVNWQCEFTFTWSMIWWMVLSQFYSNFLFLVSHYRVVVKSILASCGVWIPINTVHQCLSMAHILWFYCLDKKEH